MELALSGLKVLDLSMNLPGPYLTWLLASMGAEVVKVENPATGDSLRTITSQINDRKNLGAHFFLAINRNKKSICLNLKHPKAREVILKLLKTYDVLVEGFRPGTMRRLGLSFKDLSGFQPRLIQVSITGYGHQGLYCMKAGHDINYLALAGVLSMIGMNSGEIVLPGVQIADLFGGSLLALTALLAAVIQRQRTGEGQFIDSAMYDGALSMTTMVQAGVAAGIEGFTPGTMTLNGRYPCYRLYRCLDKKWMSMGALEPKFWSNFCIIIKRPDLISAQFGGAEVIKEIECIFAKRTRTEWTELMIEHDCCCEPVLDLKEVMASDLAASRDMLVTNDKGYTLLASPLKLGSSPSQQDKPAPFLGQHNREILQAGGYALKEVEDLLHLGVCKAD